MGTRRGRATGILIASLVAVPMFAMAVRGAPNRPPAPRAVVRPMWVLPAAELGWLGNPGTLAGPGVWGTNAYNGVGDGLVPRRATPVAAYTSYASFRRHVRSLRPGSWVMYDPELWYLTPRRDRLHPVRYARLFIALAHRHGLKVMLFPSPSLVLQPGTGLCHGVRHPGTGVWARWVDCNAAGKLAATRPDAFEIQAQGFECGRSRPGHAGRYAGFLRVSIAAVRAAGYAGPIFAGLSTQRCAPAWNGYGVPTVTELRAAASAALAAGAAGFFFYFNTASRPQVAVARAFLHLGPENGPGPS